MTARASAAPVDNPAGQLDAAAAGAELELEPLELEPLDEGELDFSDDDELSDEDELVDSELVDSELVEAPLDELLAVLLADSRLSLR